MNPMLTETSRILYASVHMNKL